MCTPYAPLLRTADNVNRYQVLPVHWARGSSQWTRLIYREGIWFVSARYDTQGNRVETVPGTRNYGKLLMGAIAPTSWRSNDD